MGRLILVCFLTAEHQANLRLVPLTRSKTGVTESDFYPSKLSSELEILAKECAQYWLTA